MLKTDSGYLRKKQNIESQVEGVSSHNVGLPWAWAKTFASGI